MANEKVVQTDVDKLLSLIEQKKQMTMEEVAKAINLPIKTVESLATLLEEEGLLHITYKFTTPYLHYGPPKSAFGEKKKEEKKVVSEELIVTKEEEAIKKGGRPAIKGGIRKAGGEMELPGKTPEGKPEEAAGMAAEEAKPKLALPEDLEQLVVLANDYLNKGDIDTAREIFLEIKRRRTNLPKEYLEKERKLKDSLVRLNELLILGIDKTLSTDFSKKQDEMNTLFAEANSLVKNTLIENIDNLKKVEDTYTKLKQLYLTLPEGFIDRRVMLQTQLLNLYKTVITNKKRLLAQDFSVKSRQILPMMSQVVAKINANDLEDAGKLLDQVNTLYATLPEGFLKEKTQLQHQILEIYQRLILRKENMYATEISAGVTQINELMRQAYVALEKSDLEKARDLFVKITDAYATLPQGFLETKAELESKMLDLHHLLSLKMNKTLMEETKRRVNEINLLLQTAQSYIINKQYDLARELYLEILGLYNTIPQGYPELVHVQTAVLNLYKQLMPYIVEVPTEKDAETQRRYNELLQLLVQIHEHIKKGEFEKIKPKYLIAYKLYHDLPLGFIDKRTELYREIYKTYHELRLYTDVNKLAEYANAKDYGRLQQALTALNETYNKLVSQYPEDIELFRYIWQRYLIYLNLLKEHIQERGPTGREVRQRIEEVAKAAPAIAPRPAVQVPGSQKSMPAAVQASPPSKPFVAATIQPASVPKRAQPSPSEIMPLIKSGTPAEDDLLKEIPEERKAVLLSQPSQPPSFRDLIKKKIAK
ncbi:hypothetical protein HY488_02120 [Candidatus Woesearchaeota archaeon]|nr:hypothetical protein [Candidatus Woesearchaeota archaeon]